MKGTLGDVSRPDISVVLLGCSLEPPLERAIRSVLAQTFTNLELIVVNDGSAADVDKIIDRFGDPRVSCLRIPRCCGVAAARNRGVRASRGRLLAFMDGDDEWTIDKLRLEHLTFERHHATSQILVCGGYIIRESSGRSLYTRPDKRMSCGEWTAESIYGFNFIASTWLMSRSSFDDLGGFDECLSHHIDWEMVLRWFGCSKKPQIIVLDEPLLIRYASTDAHKWGEDERLVSLQRILKLHAQIWLQYPLVLARLHDEIARIQCQLGEVKAGCSSFWRALEFDPWSIRRWLDWLISQLGFQVCSGTKRRSSR